MGNPASRAASMARAGAAGGRFSAALLRGALDLLLPPTCAGCEAPVSEPGTLCAGCFSGLRLITDPACFTCGLPFPSEARAGTGRVCDACAAEPPPWQRARAAFLYNEGSRGLILGLKHADRQENAVLLARQMARAGAALLQPGALLIPVPLHRWRLWRRGFNQSALLAHALGRLAPGARVLPDALRRVRHTPMLGTLSAAARRQTLAGAIAVRPARADLLRGARVLLIDDVLTSGATARACAHALLDGGAAHIDVLVAGRVPDPRS